jgi:hypothetical protein
MAISWLLLAFSLHAYAAPYFTNKEGNLIWDKATDLVWMRCTLGQTWDGKTCSGEIAGFEFRNLQNGAISANKFEGYGGFMDWAVPTIRQLQSIRECINGRSQSTQDLEDGGLPVFRQCAKRTEDPKIDSFVFPNTPWGSRNKYWSSSRSKTNEHYAWMTHFFDGEVNVNIHDWGHYRLGALRLVRASSIPANEAALIFPVNLTEKRLATEKKERADRIATENKARDERQAAENKARADRAQALSQLHALGPRGLYLEAGKAQRNGAVTFVNTSFGASQLYEMIVDKFPDSEYAVKATDQLTAMSRSSRDASAAQSAVEQSNFNAKQRAYESCKVEMNSCFSRTNGRGNCYRDCERLR